MELLCARSPLGVTEIGREWLAWPGSPPVARVPFTASTDGCLVFFSDTCPCSISSQSILEKRLLCDWQPHRIIWDLISFELHGRRCHNHSSLWALGLRWAPRHAGEERNVDVRFIQGFLPVNTSSKAGGLECEPLKAGCLGAACGGVQSNICIWSKRRSSASCRRMYSRIAVSSRPTVEAKYPRAQKCCPVKFLRRPPTVRAM